MSLAEKWDEIAMSYSENQKFFILQDLQKAFHSGAAAVMFEDVSTDEQMQAEIDHFRSHSKTGQ